MHAACIFERFIGWIIWAFLWLAELFDPTEVLITIMAYFHQHYCNIYSFHLTNPLARTNNFVNAGGSVSTPMYVS